MMKSSRACITISSIVSNYVHAYSCMLCHHASSINESGRIFVHFPNKLELD